MLLPCWYYTMPNKLFQAKKEEEKPKSNPIVFNEKTALNMIVFSFDGISFGVFHKLIDEGNNIIIAQVQDNKDIGNDDAENPESKRRRLSLYDGILEKRDAMEVL